MDEEHETIISDNTIDTKIDLDNTNSNCTDSTNCKCIFDNDCCGESFIEKFEECEITKDVTKQVHLECEGRLLKIKVRLKNVCAGKYINLGVILLNTKKEIVGFRVKKLKVPGRPCTCINVCKEFCFVFEEKNICKERKFKVLIIAHYC